MREAKRQSNLMISLVNKGIATLPMVARNDKRGFLDKLQRPFFIISRFCTNISLDFDYFADCKFFLSLCGCFVISCRIFKIKIINIRPTKYFGYISPPKEMNVANIDEIIKSFRAFVLFFCFPLFILISLLFFFSLLH